LHLAAFLGRSLPDGYAFDTTGQPTNDPSQALAGAIKVWGGHRGYGLSVAVQLLGILAGAATPTESAGHGFLFMAIRPDLFGDEETYLTGVSAFADEVRTSMPEQAGYPVRMPFDRSADTRRRLLARGTFPTSQILINKLNERTTKAASYIRGAGHRKGESPMLWELSDA
jgi:LDH2 family malate/lactate/ureidoglycolate dehydrogenase